MTSNNDVKRASNKLFSSHMHQGVLCSLLPSLAATETATEKAAIETTCGSATMTVPGTNCGRTVLDSNCVKQDSEQSLC